MMKSKRNVSISSAASASADEVDGRHNSSNEYDDDSDDDTLPVDELPVAYEYVYGLSSPVLVYKPAKCVDTKKQSKIASKSSSNSYVAFGKKLENNESVQELNNYSSADENFKEVSKVKNNQNPRLFNLIFEFFHNRKNWSVTEESIIIWLGFMFFSIVVGCILHFLMT
jgi:hypothetical protein